MKRTIDKLEILKGRTIRPYFTKYGETNYFEIGVKIQDNNSNKNCSVNFCFWSDNDSYKKFESSYISSSKESLVNIGLTDEYIDGVEFSVELFKEKMKFKGYKCVFIVETENIIDSHIVVNCDVYKV